MEARFQSAMHQFINTPASTTSTFLVAVEKKNKQDFLKIINNDCTKTLG